MPELEESESFHGYTLIRCLGAGGNGVVWLVRHEVLDLFFAVKIIDSEMFADDSEAEARFYREAKIAARIRHPALVRVYDAGRDESTGCFFLVMDYMPGGTVADKLVKVRRFSVAEATKIVHRVAMGLEELHRNGVVHRDVKPANLLFDANGEVCLSDPGIARVSVVGETRLTQEGFALGTPAYMPFEQVMDSHCVDGRADVHALGVTLFEMLAGECPFSDLNAVQVLKLRAEGKRIPDVRTLNSAVPVRLAEFIAKMTAPNVSHRVKSASEVVAEMAEFAYVDKPAVTEIPVVNLPKRISWTATAVIVALVLIAGVVAICMIGDDRRDDPVATVVPTGPEIRGLVGGPVAVEPQRRQIVETVVVSMTNTVVITNFVIAKQPTAVTNVTKAVAQKKVESPSRILSLKVCGIVLRYPESWQEDAERLRDIISEVDAEVRGFRGIGAGARVQDAVQAIVGVDDPVAGGYKYDRTAKTVEMGRKLLSDRTKTVEMVVNFMSSRGDPLREVSIAGDLDAYVRYRIAESVVPDYDTEVFYVPIRFAEAVERKHGKLDFEGRRWVGGTYRQIVTQDIAERFRRGKVFMFLRNIETRRPSLLRTYFKAKRDVSRHGRIGRSLSLNDFVALLSVGCGENLFPIAEDFGLHVSPRGVSACIATWASNDDYWRNVMKKGK